MMPKKRKNKKVTEYATYDFKSMYDSTKTIVSLVYINNTPVPYYHETFENIKPADKEYIAYNIKHRLLPDRTVEECFKALWIDRAL
jgi:hypothetical protein